AEGQELQGEAGALAAGEVPDVLELGLVREHEAPERVVSLAVAHAPEQLLEQRGVVVDAAQVLVVVAEAHPSAGRDGGPGVQRGQVAEERAEERRLPRAVRANEGDPEI